jgi:hypothetical protein
VDVGFDVVVELVLHVRLGERQQRQVGRAEPDRAARRPAAMVERAVLGAGRRRLVVVDAAEHAVLPPPAVAAGVRGQAAVARARLELRAVDAVRDEVPQQRHLAHQAVRVEVHGDVQVFGQRRSFHAARDVRDRSLPRFRPPRHERHPIPSRQV